MIVKTIKKVLAAGVLTAGLGTSAMAAGGSVELLHNHWHFSGAFGTFDRESAQRGFQVYREVCAACHGVKYVAFRALTELGYTEDQVKDFAAEYTIIDGPDEFGDMFERPGLPADTIPDPYPNKNAAAASNNGKAPPDLSLMTKARPHGPDYIYSMLQGYTEDVPADVEVPDGSYYNKYYPGHVIAMPQVLYGEDVEYQDGTPATLEQMSEDLVNFLHWAAEPRMEQRKRTGIKAIIFLVIFSALFYIMKKRVWANLH